MEPDRQCRSVGCLFELQPKSNPALSGPLELKKVWFDLMVIQPGPHLGHGGAELGAAAPDLNNVQCVPSRRAGSELIFVNVEFYRGREGVHPAVSDRSRKSAFSVGVSAPAWLHPVSRLAGSGAERGSADRLSGTKVFGEHRRSTA